MIAMCTITKYTYNKVIEICNEIVEGGQIMHIC